MLQSFGNIDNYMDADLISAVQFEEKGSFLATGDRGGRVVLFKQEPRDEDDDDEDEESEHDQFLRNMSTHSRSSMPTRSREPQWVPMYQFQSHQAEFDYLKSLEIEEKINNIKFVPSAGCMQLLSSNDKTIKLWRIGNRSFQRYQPTNLGSKSNKAEFSKRSYQSDGGGAAVVLPRLEDEHTELIATSKKEFKNAHAYHINSLSVNTDGETFLSSDDLRIIWWNLDVDNHCFNVVDLKPINMEELKEVITCAKFHPISCNQLVYATSRGALRIVDTRDSALGDTPSVSFEAQEDTNSFYSEVTASISDVEYSRCGNMLCSRDYMTVKVWDVRSNHAPLQVIEVQEHLKPNLAELYESDCIFDKFDVNFSPDGKKVLTGLYDNKCMSYD
jgi:serine/threonine-protein phosphatase 2A regulatory subunit B